MFTEIERFRIKISNSDKKVIYYCPNIISFHPLEMLFTASEWLAEEAWNDYKFTNENIEERRTKEGYSQKNLDDIDELSIRLGSRTQGYINQLCLMEDILIFEYKRMAEMILESSKGKIVISPETDYKSLKERFKPIRIFRNKVIAHTAYTYPKKEDNPETVVRSILNLFPEPARMTVGNNYFSGFSPHRSQLPVISIFEWHEMIKPIFQDWKSLFIEKIKKIHLKCPIDDKPFTVEIASPHLFRKSG
jgi:hypothetical protein